MQTHRASFYMIVAAFFYALFGLSVRLASPLPAAHISFFSGILALLFCFIGFKKKKISPWGSNYKLLILRGMIGTASTLCFLISIQNMPLSIASTIQNLSPIFAAILGIFLVGEKVALSQWLFMAISFSGVFIMKQWDTALPSWYLILGLSGAFFSGSAYSVVRRLKGKEDPLVITFYLFVVNSIPTGIYVFTHWSPLSLTTMVGLLGAGVSTVVSRYFLAKALHQGTVASVSSLLYLAIVFSLTLDFLILGQRLPWIVLSGIGVTVLGVLLNLFYNARKVKN